MTMRRWQAATTASSTAAVGGALAAPRLLAYGELRDQRATYPSHRQFADASSTLASSSVSSTNAPPGD
jgi:hypothetical protein